MALHPLGSQCHTRELHFIIFKHLFVSGATFIRDKMWPCLTLCWTSPPNKHHEKKIRQWENIFYYSNCVYISFFANPFMTVKPFKMQMRLNYRSVCISYLHQDRVLNGSIWSSVFSSSHLLEPALWNLYSVKNTPQSIRSDVLRSSVIL